MANIRIIYAPNPQQQWQDHVAYCPEQSVQYYLDKVNFYQQFPQARDYKIGIYSKPCTLATIVKATDRIEIYPPLLCDPKAARFDRVKKK